MTETTSYISEIPVEKAVEPTKPTISSPYIASGTNVYRSKLRGSYTAVKTKRTVTVVKEWSDMSFIRGSNNLQGWVPTSEIL